MLIFYRQIRRSSIRGKAQKREQVKHVEGFRRAGRGRVAPNPISLETKGKGLTGGGRGVHSISCMAVVV